MRCDGVHGVGCGRAAQQTEVLELRRCVYMRVRKNGGYVSDIPKHPYRVDQTAGLGWELLFLHLSGPGCINNLWRML